MSLITVDDAVRMKLLIKNIAPGGQKEMYKCVVCQCSTSGSISAQSHLHGLKHNKAFAKSHFNNKGTQNSTPRVGVGTKVASISKFSSTHNTIPSVDARPQIPKKFSSPQNSVPPLGFRPQVPVRFSSTQKLIQSSGVGQQMSVRFCSTQNTITSLGVRPQIPQRFSTPQNSITPVGRRPQLPVRFSGTQNSIPSIGCRPQTLGRLSCIQNSSPSLGGRPQTPVRFSRTHNSIPSLGGRPQAPMRFSCAQNSIPSLGGRPQIPVRFASTQNSISSLGGRPQIPITFSRTQNSISSLHVTPQIHVRFPRIQNSIPSLGGRPQTPVRFSRIQNSIPSANRPKISNISKFPKAQTAFKSVSIKPKNSSRPNNAITQKTNAPKFVKGKILKPKFVKGKSLKPKFVKGKILKPQFVKGKIVRSKFVKGKNLSSSDAAAKEETLIKSISLGIMKDCGDSIYSCEVCSKSLNATTQAVQHINSERHQKKLRQDPKYSHLDLPTITPSTKTSEIAQIKGSDVASINAFVTAINAAKLNPPSPKSTDILQNGIKSGLIIITKVGGQDFFKCNACNKTCGDIPMKQHITSESHKKKLSASHYKESSTTLGSSSSSQDPSQRLPEEIADILVIHPHESLDSLFTIT